VSSYLCADIHAHPALKAHLFSRNLHRHYASRPTVSPWASQSDFVVLRRGGVQLLWSSLYVPERELFEQCGLLRIAGRFLPRASAVLRGDPTEEVFRMMDEMERQILVHGDRVCLARSNRELDAGLAAGKIVVVHTVEGAHVLGNRLRSVEQLAERGVASLTLAHFFPNGVAPPVSGIPETFATKRLCKFDFGIDVHGTLTPFGEDVVREMVRLRMIVDISHCPRPAREKVFELVAGRAPVVASHTGVHGLNPLARNLADEEIREIKRSGGVVGVIFMTYWLDPATPGPGLEPICRTIRYLAELDQERGEQSFDHVALGTDFDGFTDTPTDLRDAAALPKVATRLLETGVSQENVYKIMGQNARRVLRIGWR
jgi:membrane dipeptidase